MRKETVRENKPVLPGIASGSGRFHLPIGRAQMVNAVQQIAGYWPRC
jgi:hypothetical protein